MKIELFELSQQIERTQTLMSTLCSKSENHRYDPKWSQLEMDLAWLSSVYANSEQRILNSIDGKNAIFELYVNIKTSTDIDETIDLFQTTDEALDALIERVGSHLERFYVWLYISDSDADSDDSFLYRMTYL